MNLAAAAAQAGTRVLLIDADPLSNVSVSLNLSVHPQRRTLREAGIDLPGALVCDIAPGVDVISPYDAGRCTDEEFDSIVGLLTTPSVRESYGCLIVDAPPFLGANPGQLVKACDEFILVMRAEPMAYRTLPAFLELVQRNRATKGGIQMRGILLTLAAGEQAGARWERELRGRFGTRILPNAIPYDEEVGQTALFGRIISHANPDSAVAREYASVARTLQLTETNTPAVTESPLVSLLQSAATVALAERRPMAAGSGVRRSVNPGGGGTALLDSGDDSVPTDPEVAIPTEEEEEPPARRLASRRSSQVRAVRPQPVAEKVEEIEEIEEIEPTPVVEPSKAQRTLAERKKPSSKADVHRTPEHPPTSVLPQWVVPVFLAMAVGFGLGFVQQPSYMLPVLVGVMVAAGILLILRLSIDPSRLRTGRTRVNPTVRSGRRPGSTTRVNKADRRTNQQPRKS
jgi:chromosome partitioning protein